MSAGTVILLVLVLVIIAVAAALASTIAYRRATRRRLVGAEFSRLARETGPRRARAEFAERRRRVDGLSITALSGERRTWYTRQWTAAQERFIDSPAQALVGALRQRQRQLRVMWESGASDTPGAAAAGSAPPDTEHLRLMMQRYRALFNQLCRP